MGIKQLEVEEASFNNEHETENKAGDGDSNGLKLVPYLFIKLWECIVYHLEEKCKVGIDSCKSKHDAHKEEGDTESVSSRDESHH